MNRKIALKIAMLLSFLVAPIAVKAAMDDIWSMEVWRITSLGNLIPGTNNAYSLGSSTAQVKGVYANDVVTVGLVSTPVTVTANATLASDAHLVYVGSINGNRTYVLPTPSAGRVIHIQDTVGNVSVNGNVTIDGATTNTINGALNVTLAEDFGGITLYGLSATAWAASKTSTP